MDWTQDRSDPNIYTYEITSDGQWAVASQALRFANPFDYDTVYDWVVGATRASPRILEARIKQAQLRVVGHPWVPYTLLLA